MKAKDADSGLNAKIHYSIDGPDAGCFHIDALDASLTFICEADYNMKNHYLLKVNHISHGDILEILLFPT